MEARGRKGRKRRKRVKAMEREEGEGVKEGKKQKENIFFCLPSLIMRHVKKTKGAEEDSNWYRNKDDKSLRVRARKREREECRDTNEDRSTGVRQLLFKTTEEKKTLKSTAPAKLCLYK